ncbi:ABC transporter ATP-binding protein [uncultured Amnibacterium sp.]|uniref:ABC transporter ATP-binding protein n=1 Tax=uncultured Amnibacterium sp. TaxID=1631851 RepID=UPI0035CA7181
MSVLSIDALSVRHGQLQALTDFSLELQEGETVAVVGSNGAGKSTLMGSIAGLLPAASGRITVDGRDLTHVPAHRRVGLGVSLVPEGRRLFRSLSVEENLLTGVSRGRPGDWTVDRVMDLFGWMRERRAQRAWQLSGGEQQAVAIGRALVSNPRLLMIDELSLGLAPAIIKRIYAVVPEIVAGGTAVLLVEQDISQAIRVADRVVCLLEGHTVLTGRPGDLTRDQIEDAYFGVPA